VVGSVPKPERGVRDEKTPTKHPTRLLLLTKAKTIEWVSYPVDDPAAGPRQILTWLKFNT
jgi:hypothetical protein